MLTAYLGVKEVNEDTNSACALEHVLLNMPSNNIYSTLFNIFKRDLRKQNVQANIIPRNCIDSTL